MTSRNDITGDAIRTKHTSDPYRDNYDRIFGKKNRLPVAYDGKNDAILDATLDESQSLREAIDEAMDQIGDQIGD